MRYAIASLVVPGLGQFLAGRRARGLGLFALMAVIISLTVWAATPPSTFSGTAIDFKGNAVNWRWLIVAAIVWSWTIWDAASPGASRFAWAPTLASLIMIYTFGWQASGINLPALVQNFDRA